MNAEKILIKAGLDKTYWGGIIIRAEKRGKFTVSNSEHADGWETCACGKQDGRIPRHPGGGWTSPGKYSPVDRILERAGLKFSRCVKGDNFVETAYSLIAIENRSSYILDAVTFLEGKREFIEVDQNSG